MKSDAGWNLHNCCRQPNVDWCWSAVPAYWQWADGRLPLCCWDCPKHRADRGGSWHIVAYGTVHDAGCDVPDDANKDHNRNAKRSPKGHGIRSPNNTNRDNSGANDSRK